MRFNQTTPGLTKYSLGAEINTLGMDYEMNKAFPKEGYQDSSRGKTYREETTWEKDNTVKKIDTIYQESDKKADEEAGGYLSYLGNIMNSLNTGASSATAGVLGFGEEAYRDLASLKIPVLTPLFEFSADVWKKPADYFRGDANVSRAKTAGFAEGKEFDDLWKQGRYADSLGKLYLDATESIPLSLGIMGAYLSGNVGIGSALMYASSAGNTYDDLKDNTDMTEVQKKINAHAVGAIEALSEQIGSIPVARWLQGVYKTGG